MRGLPIAQRALHFALLFLLGTAHATSPYPAPDLQVFGGRPASRGVTIRVAPLRDAVVPTASVPFTVEPWVLAVRLPPPVLAERDVLGTGLALDLDGDGKRTGRWPLHCAAGIWQVGPWTLQPLGARLPAELPRLGPRGAAVIQHTPCSEAGVVVGFDPPQDRAALPTREVLPGPLLQISVVEQRTPKEAPRLSMAGFYLNSKAFQPPRTFDVRSFVAEPKPGWVHVRLVLVPMPPAGAQVDLRIEGVGEGSVSAMVISSPGPDQRVYSPAAGQALPPSQ